MIIVRYLIRETVKTQFAVLFILFLVFFSQKFIRLLADATDGSIPSSEVMTLVALYLPYMTMLMLPLSLFIGILLTFGRLYAESEITVMNATGIGNKFLVRAALYLALITGAIAAFNALWLVPWAANKEASVYENLDADSGIKLLVKGQIQQTPDGLGVVYVNDIQDKGKVLKDVFIAQPVAKGSLQPTVAVAKNGIVSELPDGRQVLELSDGERFEGIPTRLDYSITDFDIYQVLIGQRKVDKRSRGWDAIPTMELLGKSSIRAQSELQWRISLVLCVPLMTMLVVPLSAVNPRQGRFAKLFPAILIYLTYFLSLSASRSAMDDGNLPPEVGLWMVNILALLVACILISWDSLPMRKLKDKLRRVG
ncbi:LPS export ABC transporter permease LptF [Veronia pacifica]|uniref:Lipopolysaccharide export system permease protein LptF n=1 Tax=Veronia pacifica TaxID=1080227 RepID=A0A1C3EQ82_9GAMM|nr:LPS export ABC transporter permease LptF [Veronia pacifica]ODA35404.1 LPS export ABC transporter permease LptF [Veronia pacifica]